MNMNMLLVAKAIICFHFHVWELCNKPLVDILIEKTTQSFQMKTSACMDVTTNKVVGNKCMYGCNHKQGSRSDTLYNGKHWQSLNLAVCSQN